MSSRPSEPGDKARWYDDVDWRLIGIGLAVTILVMIGVDILIVFGWPPRLNRTITESQLAPSPEALTASTAPTATLAEMTPLSTQASQAGGALSPTFTQTSQAEPDQGLTATPTQPNAALQEQLAEANALYEAFQFDAAIEQFTDVLGQEPENVEALVGRAHAYQAGYYWHESEIDYETALALDPDYAEAYYGLISLYLLRRNYGAAFQLLERAEEKCADDPYFYVVAGSVYFNMGDYQTITIMRPCSAVKRPQPSIQDGGLPSRGWGETKKRWPTTTGQSHSTRTFTRRTSTGPTYCAGMESSTRRWPICRER